MDDLVIDESNFHEYFFDVKKTGPKPGQIMARFVSRASLIAGEEKAYLIDMLLTNPMGAEMGLQIARSAFAASELEAIKLLKAIATDLADGKSKQEVLDKAYDYTLEKFFWTKEEYVPKDDPHWRVIKVSIMIPPEKNEEQQ